MTELKTLKDIFVRKDGIVEALYEKRLKAEAVKWVKEDFRCLKEGIEDDEPRISTEARIQWIKHFFNLTEEDLK